MVGASPEIREFRRIITEEDDDRLALIPKKEELDDLEEQIKSNDAELNALNLSLKNVARVSLKDKMRRKRLMDRKILLSQQYSDQNAEIARLEKSDYLKPRPNYPPNWNNSQNTVSTVTTENSKSENVINTISSAAGIISPITGLVGTAIDLIGYFRSDISFSGVSITNKDKVARFNIANALQTRYCLRSNGQTNGNRQG